MISKEKRDLISTQSLNEIEGARVFKQGKITSWQKNEDMYYGKKLKTADSRANVSLSRMQEFVHVLLSKIDNPLIFKFTKRKNAQLKRVERLNALRKVDADRDDWDMKDLVGKKQAILYGRAVYSYHADSVEEYLPHLENIDIYNFLIDPDCGGINIEEASYMGDYSITYSKQELEEGAKKAIKDGGFIAYEVQQIIDGEGNVDENTQENTNADSRTDNQDTISPRESENTNLYKFWRWYTTYEDVRYYLLIDNNGRCIKCQKLVELFPATKHFPKGAYPYWTWACFPDLTEFWTPSYCDYAREIFMVEDVSINQMLDNAEAINKPMKIVNVNAIENEAELKYRKDGYIKSKKDINKAYRTVETPSIVTPIKVYELMESIQQKSSGVTENTAGTADEKGKVGIYEGNKEAEADRFGLLNKSYAYGYKRFARLYEEGVREHLIQDTAIDVLGADGVDLVKITRGDIFKKGEDFGLMVEASNAQLLATTRDKNTKILFLQNQVNNPAVNQKKMFEMQAEIVGMSEDEIAQLLDVSLFGDIELMSECDRDIEALLENDNIKPNKNANNAYKQKMVNYLKEHEEDIDIDQFTRISQYIVGIDKIIMRNEARQLQEDLIQRQKAMMLQQEVNPTSGTQENQEPIKLEENQRL